MNWYIPARERDLTLLSLFFYLWRQIWEGDYWVEYLVQVKIPSFTLTSAILWRRVDALRQREQVLDRRGVLARRGRHRRHLHLVLPRHLGIPVHQVHEVSQSVAFRASGSTQWSN